MGVRRRNIFSIFTVAIFATVLITAFGIQNAEGGAVFNMKLKIQEFQVQETCEGETTIKMELTARADKKGDGFDPENDVITFAVLDKDGNVIAEPKRPVGCMIPITPDKFKICPTEILPTGIDELKVEVILDKPLEEADTLITDVIITGFSPTSPGYHTLHFTIGDDEGETTIKKVDEKKPESSCVPTTEVGLCEDGLDNDEDGLTDCNDFDCKEDLACGEP